jgi:hypothetical protein
MVARGWCQGVAAEDARGQSVLATDLGACRWCALGAMGHSRGLLHLSPLYSAGGFEGGSELVEWNDEAGRTQADVLALYDAAIAAEEGQS